MAEAHALCSRLESALQDTVKQQDRSFTVTACGEPSLSIPFLSAANEETVWHQPWLRWFQVFVVISCSGTPSALIILILTRGHRYRTSVWGTVLGLGTKEKPETACVSRTQFSHKQ